MNLKIISIFFLAIFIPTSLLAYFGILAVRSEKDVIEKNMVQKYKAMADIVEGQIKQALSQASHEELADTSYWESLLVAQAAIFKDEVAIFSPPKARLAIGGQNGRPVRADVRAALRRGIFAPLWPGFLILSRSTSVILSSWNNWNKGAEGLILYIGLIVFRLFPSWPGVFTP